MRFTFIGCSFTVGVGLNHEKNDVNNYTNIVANHCSADVKNSAVGGNSNYNIFMTAVNEILFNTPDKIFTSFIRYIKYFLFLFKTIFKIRIVSKNQVEFSIPSVNIMMDL